MSRSCRPGNREDETVVKDIPVIVGEIITIAKQLRYVPLHVIGSDSGLHQDNRSVTKSFSHLSETETPHFRKIFHYSLWPSDAI